MSARDPQSKSHTSATGAPLDLCSVREILGATRLGNKFHYFEQIGSTNTHARELAEGGAAEGEVVIADSQTGGRGRLDRRWESPPATNLYFSVVLRPKLAPQHAAQITLMAAVGVAEAVASFLEHEVTIKWPNDILVDGRKIAGILAEASCGGGGVEYVILGVGLNVNAAVDSMPDAIRHRATSLFDLTGKIVPRENVLHRLIHDLDRCYGVLETHGFDALRPRWEARFNLRGKRVRAESAGEVVVGRARGIDHGGALVLEDENGMLRTIIAGEVIPLER